MRPNLILSILLISSSLSIAQIPVFQWAKSFGGAGNDISSSIAVDATGNVYVTGSFSGTVDFDPGVGVYTLTCASSDVFVSKFDALGGFLWAQQFGGTGTGNSNALAIDASGNVYTTGYFVGTFDFDPGIGALNLTANGGYDVFVSKLNSSGAMVWTKQMGGSSFEIGYGIAVDALGNVFTTGTFQGAGDYDPGAGNAVLTPAGSADCFISKLNSSGNFVWAKQFEASNTALGNAVTTDTAGNVFISGFFSGAGDFDPGPGIFPFLAAGSTDIFVSKLTSAGVFVWAAQMGGTLGDWSTSIVVDAAGNVYTTGRFEDVVDFDPGPGNTTFTSTGASADIYLSKLNSSGTFVWAKQLGGPGDDIAKSIALDVTGNVYTIGSFNGTADFDPSVVNYPLASAGGNEVFISKLSAAGNFMLAFQLGGTNADIGQSLAIDSQDFIHCTGYYWGACDFDPAPAVYSLTSTGDNDIFIAKIGQCVIPASPTNSTLPINLGVCNGFAATLTAISPSANIDWFNAPTGGSILGSGTTFITPTLSTGNYTYYAQATTCTVNPVRTIFTLTVSPLPTMSASTNIVLICIPFSSTLAASGVSSATWQPGGLVGTTVVVSPTITTAYTVSGGNGPGCTVVLTLTQSVSDCSGIDEMNNSISILNVFPNPASNEMNIQNNFNSEADLYFYDSHAKLLFKEKYGRDETPIKINTSNFVEGIYYLRINSAGKNYRAKVAIAKLE